MRRFFSYSNQFGWYTSPFLFALIFTIILLIFNPDIFNPYRVDTRFLPKERANHNLFINLDNDEYTESISFSKDERTGKSFIEVSKERYFFKDDYSLEIMATFVADYNHDSFKEIYFCTNYKDSLFINSFDYKTKTILYKYIGSFNKSVKSSNSIAFLAQHDFNSDSFDEIYFYVNGKVDEPLRSVIRFDVRNNKIKKSPNIKSIIVNAFTTSFENKFRIVYSTWGLRKSSKSYSSDSLSYVKAQYAVLDDNLDLMFKPIEFEGENKAVGSLKVSKKGENYVWLFIDTVNTRIEGLKDKTLIEIFSLDGKLVKSSFINYDTFVLKNAYFTLGNSSKEDVFITLRSGGLLRLDKDLKYLKRIKIKDIEYPMLAFSGDVDGDGSIELLFHDNFKKNNVIVKDNFSLPVLFTRPKPYDNIEGITLVGKVRESKHNSIGHVYVNSVDENLYFESKYLSLFIRYYKENTHWYKYVYLVIFFVFVYLCVTFIRYLVALNVKQKYEVKNRIAELRFKNISNQMSPHFTMNAMNSIASLIYKEDKEKAYDYLSKLAKLMKMSLLDASKANRTLNEEISFVRAYLDLQLLRFKDRFEYIIDNNDVATSKILLMPFIVQIFVENAIKHGIKNLGRKGLIQVIVKSHKDGVLIIVEDNGVGRKQAILTKTLPSTGKGTLLVKEYIEVLNKRDNRHMSINIIDLYDKDKASGTRVEIYIDRFDDIE